MTALQMCVIIKCKSYGDGSHGLIEGDSSLEGCCFVHAVLNDTYFLISSKNNCNFPKSGC